MATTRQVVERAIERSVSHNEITHIRLSDLPDGDTLADAEEVLRTECEDSVRANSEHEFWGTTADGDEWRVHVVLS